MREPDTARRTPADEAVTLVEGALLCAGSTASLAMRLVDETDDGDEHQLVLDGSKHVPAGVLALVRTMRLSANNPIAEAVRSGQAVACSSVGLTLEAHSLMAPLLEATSATGFVAIPVRYQSLVRGVVAVFLDASRELSAAERLQLQAMSAPYARSVHQSRLYFSERDAHARAEGARASAERTVSELTQSRDDLKARVRNRTSELARMNAELVNTLAERSRADEERRLLRLQLTSAEEDERRRIARELHDQLGQHLTALRLGIDEVQRLLVDPERARMRLDALQELARAMTHDVRHLALDLRPPELDDVGLESALETYVHEWSKRFGITAELAFTGRRTTVPSDIGTALYRIVQEALTNVVKHAKATAVGIVVERTDVDVRLIVEDDGAGFDLATTQHRVRAERRLGLAGMRERASVVGGELTVESSPGRGTTVYVCLPLCPTRMKPVAPTTHLQA